MSVLAKIGFNTGTFVLFSFAPPSKKLSHASWETKQYSVNFVPLTPLSSQLMTTQRTSVFYLFPSSTSHRNLWLRLINSPLPSSNTQCTDWNFFLSFSCLSCKLLVKIMQTRCAEIWFSHVKWRMSRVGIELNTSSLVCLCARVYFVTHSCMMHRPVHCFQLYYHIN